MKKCLIAILFVIASMATFAQSSEIWGFVYDEHEFPIIKATISLSDTANPKQVLLTAFTDKGGRYVMQKLKPGKYNVTISCSGYETRSEEGIWINGDKAVVLDVKLKKQ